MPADGLRGKSEQPVRTVPPNRAIFMDQESSLPLATPSVNREPNGAR